MPNMRISQEESWEEAPGALPLRYTRCSYAKWRVISRKLTCPLQLLPHGICHSIMTFCVIITSSGMTAFYMCHLAVCPYPNRDPCSSWLTVMPQYRVFSSHPKDEQGRKLEEHVLAGWDWQAPKLAHQRQWVKLKSIGLGQLRTDGDRTWGTIRQAAF